MTHGDCVNAAGTLRGTSVVPVPTCSWVYLTENSIQAGGGDDPAVLLGFELD